MSVMVSSLDLSRESFRRETVPKAGGTLWLLLVNVPVGVLATSIEIHIVRLQTSLSLVAKWLRRNWNSGFGNCSCFYFAFETFLFIVVENFEENCCFSSFWVVKTSILIYSQTHLK